MIVASILIPLSLSGCVDTTTSNETLYPQIDKAEKNELDTLRIVDLIFLRNINSTNFEVMNVGSVLNKWSEVAVNASEEGFRIAFNETAQIQNSSRLQSHSWVVVSDLGTDAIKVGQFLSFCDEEGEGRSAWFYLSYPSGERWSNRLGGSFDVPSC